jgi:hypothetical protein
MFGATIIKGIVAASMSRSITLCGDGLLKGMYLLFVRVTVLTRSILWQIGNASNLLLPSIINGSFESLGSVAKPLLEKPVVH